MPTFSRRREANLNVRGCTTLRLSRLPDAAVPAFLPSCLPALPTAPYLPDLPFPAPTCPARPASHKREPRVAKVAVENRARIAAEPRIDHARIDRAEVGLVAHVAGTVLERRVRRVSAQIGRRPVETAVHPAAHRQHHR